MNKTNSENEQEKLKNLEEKIRSMPPAKPRFVYRVKINLAIIRHTLSKYPGYIISKINKRLGAQRSYFRLRKGIRLTTTFVVIVALLIVGTVGLAYAADPAAPGDNLYGVDRGFEKVEVLFYIAKEGKAYKFILLAKERLEELEKLSKENKLNHQYINYLNGQYENHLAVVTSILKTEKINSPNYIEIRKYLLEHSTLQNKILDEVSKNFPEVKNNFKIPNF